MAALNTWAGCRGEAQSRKPLDFTLSGRQREAMAGVDHDLVLAGGGLAAGPAALASRQMRPEVDVAIVEQGQTTGGKHLWRSAQHTTELQSLQRISTAVFSVHKKK